MNHPRNRLIPVRNESSLRRQSFQNGWPPDKNFLSIDELVNQGFYYLGLGNGDKVQCVYCAGVLSNWEQNDNIHNEHKQHFPLCPMMISPYKYPAYKDLSVRKLSYTEWPPQIRQKPDDLAEAGLFYLGHGDKTKCFWCGIMISEWEPNDIPIVEHAKISTQLQGQPCQWLIACKGKEFVDLILQSGQEGVLHQESLNPETSAQASSSAPVVNAASPVSTVPLEALQMGFDQITIDEAMRNLGLENEINLDSLVQAILEVQSSQASGSTPNNIDANALSQENRELRDKTMCKICGQRQVNLVFLPCGHLVCCTECGVEVNNCPACFNQVTEKIHVFI